MTRRAFTLIELLVVIAIISVLVALSLFAIRGARAAGWRVTCLSNQRQIGVAVHTYANDYADMHLRESGAYPCMYDDRYSVGWAWGLRPYLDDTKGWDLNDHDLYADAAYYRDPARVPAIEPDHPIHYVVNGTGFHKPEAGETNYRWKLMKGMRRRDMAKFPSQTLYLTGFTRDEGALRYNYTFNSPWDVVNNLWVAAAYDASYINNIDVRLHRSWWNYDPAVHGDGSNVVYFDGHAAFTRTEEWDESYKLWNDHDYTYPEPGSSPGKRRHCPHRHW